ncbi:MAG: aminomethyl-transferring glycine dehydrogenase subunit GcvPA [bacterium]
MSYIPHTDEDRRLMLETIGVDSILSLFGDIPKELLINGPLKDLPGALDEYGIVRELTAIAAKNGVAPQYISFLGAGIYDHFIPSVVGAIIERGEFLTAYTPYQPEMSQGNLQAIYEYQSLVCELTGMEMSNASMYDAGSALAEAALMAVASTDRTQILVSEAVHPHYRDCINTYAWAQGLEVTIVPAPDGLTEIDAVEKHISDKTACVVSQYPNFFGQVEDLEALSNEADKHGALSIVCVNPISLALLKPPGELGADIVVGEGQPLGSPMGFGGPLLGMFACRKEFARRLPGRIIGRTTDKEGKQGFVMTLRAREQDIRREKATSNICTNEALIALAASVFLSAVGKHGLRAMAEASLQNAHYASKEHTKVDGVELRFNKRFFFNEFALKLPCNASHVRDELIKEGLLGGLPLGSYYSQFEDTLLVAVTEKRTKAEIDHFAQALRRVCEENQ